MDDAYLEKVAELVERDMAGLNTPELTKTRATYSAPAGQPRNGGKRADVERVEAAPAKLDAVTT
jgi:hypothetical protein